MLRDIFIARSGTADVFVTDRRGVEHRVGQVLPSATLGEMSLFRGQPTSRNRSRRRRPPGADHGGLG